MKRALLSVLLAMSLLLGSHSTSPADQLARTREVVRPEIEGDPDEPQATVPVHDVQVLDDSISNATGTGVSPTRNRLLRLLLMVRFGLWRSAW